MPRKRPPEELLELTKPHARQFPIVEGTMCVEVRVPAHIAYVALLQGFVAKMTDYYSFQGTMEERKAVAALAQEAYVETDWMACMNCEELIECIQPLLDAQTLQITNNILNQSNYGMKNPGVPLTGEQSAANIAEGTNPTCDLDVLWAQCLALIDRTNQAIVDVLEQVEVATNVNELAGLIDAIPALGLFAELLGSEAVTDTINYFQEAVQEEYNAQYTEDVRFALACQLFCACRFDCVISVDRLFDMLAANVISLIPTTPSDLIDLIDLIAGVDFDGSEVVNMMFYFAWAGVKLAQVFVGDIFLTTTFQVIVQLAVDDASSDWTLLCETCHDGNANIYADFARTILIETRPFEIGTPFDIVVDDPDFPEGEMFVTWGALPLLAHYEVIAGTINPTVAEAPYAYIEPDDDIVTGPAGDTMNDMPNDVEVKGMFFNNDEATTPAFTVRITLDLP